MTTRLAALLALSGLATGALASEFQLSEQCPPSFERTTDNSCRLHSLYDQYNSLYGRGVGGLKTALPSRRDGFSPQQIDLGRFLFFDPLLSADNSLSCASCHHPDLGFADGRATALGVGGAKGHRGAPSLWNMAFLTRFFWDARASSLEAQMQGPLYAPEEMGTNPAQLLQKLNANDAYRAMFEQAFPNADQYITLDQIYTAIAAFETSLVSLNSPYDRYAHGHHQALSEPEIEGLNIFRSFVARCAECHTPPLFTNQQIAVIGIADGEGNLPDEGAGAVFNNPSWRGGFKVPSLRNIARTAPYMHNGMFDSLKDAARFYTLGRGHALNDKEKSNTVLHWHIWEPKLTDAELDRLVDFMNTLTDEQFTPAIPNKLPSGLKPVGALPPALSSPVARNN
ncbi:cytochrome-c peroxidase [Simiduia sp. 21SJ11W-1]|nr:cytochrome c peroxidase [Simiduia sp. 21SJ11W-1]UTA49672.1 cytochrome-c peroxidase [Simiduia sp. 21SJ11W-1]